jgi:hypothetical protein
MFNHCQSVSEYIVADKETAVLVANFFDDTNIGAIFVGNREFADQRLKKNQIEYLLQENYRFPVLKEAKDPFGNDCWVSVFLIDETYELAKTAVFRIYSPVLNDYIEVVGLEAAIDARYDAQMKYLESVYLDTYQEFDSDYIIQNQQQVNSS